MFVLFVSHSVLHPTTSSSQRETLSSDSVNFNRIEEDSTTSVWNRSSETEQNLAPTAVRCQRLAWAAGQLDLSLGGRAKTLGP